MKTTMVALAVYWFLVKETHQLPYLLWIVELRESLIIRMKEILTKAKIFTQILQPNSSLIKIIDNDGNLN